jgi:predicted nuclease of predicted toxin-antitoxin system
MSAEPLKFYTDEHVPRAVIEGLRRRGLDVLSTQEAGMLGASDEEHLALAASEGRIIFTQADDFLRLHARGISHCGIVYARQQTPIGVMVRGLMLVYEVLDAEEMRDHVEFL